MKMMFARVFTIVCLTGSALAAQDRAFTPEDWYKIARVGGGTLSPDGNTLALAHCRPGPIPPTPGVLACVR